MKWILALLLLPLASAGAFDSGDIAVGETWTKTFTEENSAGYTYHCHPHPWMEAMVHVNPDTDGETITHEVDIVEGETAEEWGYSIEHLAIEVGDTVIWTNQGTMVHTVTESGEGDGDHEHGDHEHGDHDHGDTGDKDSSAAPLLGVLAMIGLAAFLRRK